MRNKILIAADIVPTKSNEAYFAEGNTERLIGEELTRRLADADFIAMNLETPLADRISPITKQGPCLIAPTRAVKGLKAINPFFYTLANNHILDQGESGLKSTMETLRENGISFAGAGADLREAEKPLIREIGGRTFGFYCCAEHEFSIAGENSCGANPYDPLESFDRVRELKAECRHVIVLYHGGKEQYRYPSPGLRRIFRKFADCGADIVIAQHTHCIGCEEKYKGSTLVYGQGNFLFDGADNEYWNSSLLAEITFDNESDSLETGYIPLVKKAETVRAAEGDEAQQILAQFRERSEELQRDGFVEKAYEKLAETLRYEYYFKLSGGIGSSLPGRVLNRLTGRRFMDRIYPASKFPAVENVLECEAHRELAAAVFRSKDKERKPQC